MNKIYLFYGNDLNFISEKISEIVNNESNNGELNHEVINLETQNDFEELLNSTSTLNLFAQNSLMEIKLSYKLLLSVEEEFLSFINNTAKLKTVIIVLSLDKYNNNLKNEILKSKLLKGLKDVAQIEEAVKLRYWQKDQIKSKINLLAKKYNLQFDNNAQDLICECFGDDLDNLNQDFLKLKTYTMPDNHVSCDVIKDLFLSKVNIDDLFKALVSNKQGSFRQLVDALNKSYSSLYLIASLQNKLRSALGLKTYLESNMNIYQISKLMGVNFYRLEKESQDIKNISSDQIKKTILILSDLEYKVKSGYLKDDKALDLLFLSK